MRRNKRTIRLITALCALLMLSGCADTAYRDPLTEYGVGADLPRLSPAATAEPEPTPTVEPTAEPVWWETPLLDSDESPSRPTRRPPFIPYAGDILDDYTTLRQSQETQTGGTLMANAASGSIAYIRRVGDAQWLYFTLNKKLYRRSVSGGALNWSAGGAQLIEDAFVSGLITLSDGGMAGVADGRRIIRLYDDGLNVRSETVAEYDAAGCLTRWGDDIYYVAQTGGASALYRLPPDEEPERLLDGVRLYQLDAVEGRIAALDDAGIRLCALDGTPLYYAIGGDISAFCYGGTNIYYSCAGRLYQLSSNGTVSALAQSAAAWIGYYDGLLFYVDDGDALHRIKNGDDVVIVNEAYNPTLLSDRIVFATAPDTGVGGESEY